MLSVDEVFLPEDEDTLQVTAAFAITTLFDLARVVTWTAFMSYAYLEFIRPSQSDADHFR